MNKIEVIGWTVEDAINIEKGNGDRIELLVELEHGGLTPPVQLVKDVLAAVNIPVRVMVRDIYESFVYDNEVHQSHLNFINEIKKFKPEGIVYGSLTAQNEINYSQLKDVIEAKGEMKLTFNRAFDELDENSSLQALEKLKEYEIDTILTSGNSKSALEGKENIRKYILNSENIQILPGSKIDLSNCLEIKNYTKANWLHIGMAVRDKNGNIDMEKIKKMKEVINNG
ncbi:MAG: copper homeostasis protein [Candidatus Tyloplasma litorale]|nr:MAG: copper homeostasis protein [Mycoplasmatales bacterium]